jgi:hypothetical protein
MLVDPTPSALAFMEGPGLTDRNGLGACSCPPARAQAYAGVPKVSVLSLNLKLLREASQRDSLRRRPGITQVRAGVERCVVARGGRRIEEGGSRWTDASSSSGCWR